MAENPMQSTCRNFWKMIVDYKCHAIVMMGLTDEEGKVCAYKYSTIIRNSQKNPVCLTSCSAEECLLPVLAS